MNDSHRQRGHLLRKGRLSEPGRIYHLTAVTYRRNPLFHDLANARILIRAMHRFHADGEACSLTFVVMPDHLHWLISLSTTMTLPTFMSRFKAVSAKDINLANNRTGQRVWQRGYHDHAIRREEDVRDIARYIVANPLRAGLVKQIGDYPHWDATWL